MTTQTYSRKRKPKPFSKKRPARRKFFFGLLAGVALALSPQAYQGVKDIHSYARGQYGASFYPELQVAGYIPKTLDQAADCVWRIADGRGTGIIYMCKPLDNGRTIKAGDGSEVTLPPRYRVLVLTAEHVIQDLPYGEETPLLSLHNRWGTKILFNGKVAAAHPDEDVALLEFISNEPIEPIHHTLQLPKFGDVIHKLGYGASRNSIWPSKGLYAGGGRFTANITGGDSGGAVLDSQNRLIGIIVTMGLQRARFSPFPFPLHEHGNMVPLEDIEEWLNATVPLVLNPPKPAPAPEEAPEDKPEDKPEETPKADDDTKSESPHAPSPPTGPKSQEKPKASSQTPSPKKAPKQQ